MIKYKKQFNKYILYKKISFLDYSLGIYVPEYLDISELQRISLNLINIKKFLKKKNLNNLFIFFFLDFSNFQNIINFLEDNKDFIYLSFFKLKNIIFFDFLKIYYFLFFSFKQYFIFLFYLFKLKVLFNFFFKLKAYGNITTN